MLGPTFIYLKLLEGMKSSFCICAVQIDLIGLQLIYNYVASKMGFACGSAKTNANYLFFLTILCISFPLVV